MIQEILNNSKNHKIERFCVYQGQGVCEILPEKPKEKYDGFIYLKNVVNNMKILVPASGEALKRFRGIISAEEARFLQNAQNQLNKCSKKFANWNRKYRYYMEIINENDAEKICQAIQEISYEASTRELNFSEKKLLATCKDILNTEISLALRNS